MNPAFERYTGIDYSGAATPKSSLKGLRVCEADSLRDRFSGWCERNFALSSVCNLNAP